jgi:hypothetical protein
MSLRPQEAMACAALPLGRRRIAEMSEVKAAARVRIRLDRRLSMAM